MTTDHSDHGSETFPKSPGLGTAVAALGGTVVIWAGIPIFLKYVAPIMDAWTVNGLRYVFAMLFWLPYLVRHRRALAPQAAAGAGCSGRNIWRDAVPPAAVHVVGQALFALTPYFNDATVINFVSRSSFLFTTVFGFTLLAEERPVARSPLFWTGVAATAAGLTAMYRGGVGTPSTSPLGMVLLLSTSACLGLYAVLVRRCMRGYPVRLSYGVISLYAGPAFLLLMFTVGNWRAAAGLGALQWLLLWFSAVTGLALGHVFYYRSIHTLGPIASEGGLLLIPFVTVLLSLVTLHERLNAAQWIGGLVLVAGSLFLVVSKARAGGRRTRPAGPVVAPATD